MNIKPYDKTIKELLVSGRQFSIPRFQREYSWEQKNYQEFFEDMMNNLVVKKGKIESAPYFLGTMLFIGDYLEGNDKKIEVVDGQQRLTTITILFSAMSDCFMELKECVLSKQIFRYIMTLDDDGNDVRILQSKTHYPFFSFYIQDRKKEIKQIPSSEEEICIQETYEYLRKQLEEKNLKKILKKRYGSTEINELDYIDILKALRNQVLDTTFVSISTTNKEQANMIFEILNAKGKRLAHVDLIKNKIFEVLDTVEPADYAEEKWNAIKGILYKGKETVGLATFYRHFWIAMYKKSSSNKLYDDFCKELKTNSEKTYIQFLEEMEQVAMDYMKILNPKREDYENRKEYYGVVQSLHILTEYFNIVQVRIAILVLMKLKRKGWISLKTFKSTLLYLENFHFAYNAIVSGRANKFEGIYAKFAKDVRNCEDKSQISNIINRSLLQPLDKLYPTFEQFSSAFEQLTFSKKEDPNNLKSKYIINKISCYYQKAEVFSDEGSVEHIIPESQGDVALNIGNLILLEVKYNSDCDNLKYKEKKAVYENSSYIWIKEFVEQNEEWNEDMISCRAKCLAKLYYEEILGKVVNKEN